MAASCRSWFCAGSILDVVISISSGSSMSSGGGVCGVWVTWGGERGEKGGLGERWPKSRGGGSGTLAKLVVALMADEEQNGGGWLEGKLLSTAQQKQHVSGLSVGGRLRCFGASVGV
jgi:hypothetical protein